MKDNFSRALFLFMLMGAVFAICISIKALWEGNWGRAIYTFMLFQFAWGELRRPSWSPLNDTPEDENAIEEVLHEWRTGKLEKSTMRVGRL